MRASALRLDSADEFVPFFCRSRKHHFRTTDGGKPSGLKNSKEKERQFHGTPSFRREPPCEEAVAPLQRLLEPGWEPISFTEAEERIKEKLVGTPLRWKGWYAFRRGMKTILWELGVASEGASLILRNTKGSATNFT